MLNFPYSELTGRRLISKKFIKIDRTAAIKLPSNMEGWLDTNSLARFVVEVVEQLDTSEIEGKYKGGGSAPYPPKMMLALLFYCYAKGIFSSRQIEKATYELIPVLYITGGTHPDHDSINTFRKRFLGQLQSFFVQILEYACTLGIFQLGDISIDGTKIQAHASKHKAMSWEYANKLEVQLTCRSGSIITEVADRGGRKLSRLRHSHRTPKATRTPGKDRPGQGRD